jgi:hypothetical protein
MKYLYFLLIILSSHSFIHAQDWEILNYNTINKQDPISYSDNIEMSGKKVAGIITYSIDSLGYVKVHREIIYPQLIRYLKDSESGWKRYRAYLKDFIDDSLLPKVYVNEKQLTFGKTRSVRIDGTLHIDHMPSPSGAELKRIFYPSSDQRLFIENWTIINRTDSLMDISIANTQTNRIALGKADEFIYGVESYGEIEGITLGQGESYDFDISFHAKSESEYAIHPNRELEKRKKFLNAIQSKLTLETPDSVLNTLFEFSKVRAAESIYDSKMGLVHSPGGGRYYAGVWANDQAEYSGPFFPYLGLDDGNTAALNAYKKFYQQMKTIPNHDNNLWSSFEMSGDLTCCGGDRGDAAMIAYGGLHYLMATGDLVQCIEYEPMINWCLTYNHKKLNSEGVVQSDTDEMEGRIATGSANLSTSTLYYGALDLAIDYYNDIGFKKSKINLLKKRKKALGLAIESYFGAHVEGLDTYKYFKEHQHLRHWICMPLVVGLHNRKDPTIKALFESLWTENGVHVEKNSENHEISKIFWDRGSLYAFRGTFIA